MRRSTVLYTCNDTGMHSVDEAIQYGLVVYDCRFPLILFTQHFHHPPPSPPALPEQQSNHSASFPSLEPTENYDILCI